MSDVVTVLRTFLYQLTTQFNVVLKIVRSDNGTESFNKNCHALFDSHGIIHQSSCVYTSQQNGILERKHRHILDGARALEFSFSILDRYWGDVSFKEHIFPFAQTLSHGSSLVMPSVLHDRGSLPMDHVIHSPVNDDAVIQEPTHAEPTHVDIATITTDAGIPSSENTDASSTNTGDNVNINAHNEGVEADNHEANNNENRRSGRITKAPLWHEDFITTGRGKEITYPMSNYISYHKLSAKYRDVLANFLAVVEPHNF
ncbi:uncharacterized protein LOC132067093 [Lycium ferocissimum]|uniref:uncharacterized protein LOC132067093 n=1 Tax=Lycium ferocissimum TaxID=112874 RepID=UPI00281537B6|nr:uncharacterized protein LOC132067093 [Lycium ferocissimum]